MQSILLWFALLGSMEILLAERPGMLGTVTEHPDRLAGVWEVRAAGVTYGIAVGITTTVAGQPTTLAGVRQTVTEETLAVFARPGALLRLGEMNGFTAGGPGIVWTATHLALSGSSGFSAPKTDLDLNYDLRRDTWSGRFRRGDFDQNVVLRRPHSRAGTQRSALDGTWSAAGALGQCLHIAQSEDGAFTLWDDRTVTPGLLRWKPGLEPPATTLEFYGRLGTAEPAGPNALYVNRTAFSVGGNPIAGPVYLLPDGNHVSTGFDQVRGVRTGVMDRARGGSCLTP